MEDTLEVDVEDPITSLVESHIYSHLGQSKAKHGREVQLSFVIGCPKSFFQTEEKQAAVSELVRFGPPFAVRHRVGSVIMITLALKVSRTVDIINIIYSSCSFYC